MKERLVTGGCFDILHDSHREWLKIVASHASYIKLLLQSDEVITQKKGIDRPLFPYEWRKRDIEGYLNNLGVPFKVHKREAHQPLKDFMEEGYRFVAPKEEYFYVPNHLYIPEVGKHHTSDIYKALIDARESSTCEVRKVGAVLISPNGKLQGKASNGPPLDKLGVCQKYDAYLNRYGSDKTLWAKDGYFVECSWPHAEERLLEGRDCKGWYIITTTAPCLKCAQAIVRADISRVSCLKPYKNEQGVNYLRQHNVQIHCKG